MEYQTIIGLFASTLTTTSLLPQLVKTIKEKKSEGVSVVMLVVLFAGLLCWVYYGILKSDLIIVISNSIAMAINLAVGVLTLFYKRRSKTNNTYEWNFKNEK